MMYPFRLFEKKDLITIIPCGVIGLGCLAVGCVCIGTTASIISFAAGLVYLATCCLPTTWRLLNRRTIKPTTLDKEFQLAIVNHSSVPDNVVENWIHEHVCEWTLNSGMPSNEVHQASLPLTVYLTKEYPITLPDNRRCKAYTSPDLSIVIGRGDPTVSEELEVQNLLKHELNHVIHYRLTSIWDEDTCNKFCKEHGL